MPDLAFTSLRAAHLGGVDGEFRRGRVSAILGPSGAGKTTLLSVLAGRVPRTGGAITLDGEPADLRGLRQHTGGPFSPPARALRRVDGLGQKLLKLALVKTLASQLCRKKTCQAL